MHTSCCRDVLELQLPECPDLNASPACSLGDLVGNQHLAGCREAQSFCAAWNEWAAARSVYLGGGDAQPAVDTARALLQLGQRLALAPTDRAGFQFLLEEFTGHSQLTDPDIAVNHRSAQSFASWLTNTCA